LAGNGWSIVEADSFDRGVAGCGGHRVVEEAIAPIKLGLSRNPGAFLATNTPGISLAKTKLHWNGPDIILAYSVWFRIIEKNKTVELLHVEWTDPEIDEWDNDETKF